MVCFCFNLSIISCDVLRPKLYESLDVSRSSKILWMSTTFGNLFSGISRDNKPKSRAFWAKESIEWLARILYILSKVKSVKASVNPEFPRNSLIGPTLPMEIFTFFTDVLEILSKDNDNISASDFIELFPISSAPSWVNCFVEDARFVSWFLKTGPQYWNLLIGVWLWLKLSSINILIIDEVNSGRKLTFRPFGSVKEYNLFDISPPDFLS